MYMDDLKLYAESRQDLRCSISVVEDVSEAIGMTMGLSKCATAHVVRGKVVQGGGLKLTMKWSIATPTNIWG